MANLFTVLPGLQPTLQEVAEAELLAKQILEAQFPDLDLREGTGLRDTVLRPSAVLLALVRKAIDFYFSQNTLQGVTNDSPQDLVDEIMSNWFMDRNLGTRAIVNARLFFARSKNVTITSDVYFSTDGSLKFFPQETVSMFKEALTYDSFNNEYYIDLDLVSETEGPDYNIGQGALLYFSNFDPYFLRADINFLKEASIASESNTQFIERSGTAISTRNLINIPSIDSNMRQTFNYLNRLITIGMGQEEMIRDQVKAVFEDQLPRDLTNLISAGMLATATLPGHGYNTGQRVLIEGATPTVYNGVFSITVTGESSFTYELLTPASIVTSLPSVTAVNDPVLIHTGGMVDVYCGETLANSLVQLTTDEFGKVELTGPVFSFKRSEISGGDNGDSLPFTETLGFQNHTFTMNTKLLNIEALSHGLHEGKLINVTGLDQRVGISTITSLGLTVTVVSPDDVTSLGDEVVISGVVPTDYNGRFQITKTGANTFTYQTDSYILESGDGPDMVAINPDLNKSYPISTLTNDDFNLFIENLWSDVIVDDTGLTLTYNVEFTVKDKNTYDRKIESLTCSGKTVTLSLAKHNLIPNRYITITGATPNAYNGTWLIDTVINPDQLTFTILEDVAIPGSGNMVMSSVIPWFDYGFSPRQALILDFGTQYPMRTVSLDIDFFEYLDGLQQYLESPASRVLCGDLLARGFNFYILDVKVTAYKGLAPSTGLVAQSLQAYLDRLAAGETFVVADAISQLNVDGVNGIKTPLDIQFTKYTRDLGQPKTGVITDYLDPNDRTNIFLLGEIESVNEVI